LIVPKQGQKGRSEGEERRKPVKEEEYRGEDDERRELEQFMWEVSGGGASPPSLSANRKGEGGDATQTGPQGSDFDYGIDSPEARLALAAMREGEDEWRDLSTSMEMEGTAPQEFIDTQEVYFKAIKNLVTKGGLKKARAMELVCTWSRGACVHIQRALPTDEQWCKKVDQGVLDFVGELMGVSMDRRQRNITFRKCAAGGLGFGSCLLRSSAAWLGAWEGGLHDLAKQMDVATITEFRQVWPEWDKAVKTMEKRLREHQGITPQSSRWEAAFNKAQSKKQKEHSMKIEAWQDKSTRMEMSKTDGGRLDQAGGSGAAAFMAPGEDEDAMDDAHYAVVVRRRLLEVDPAITMCGKCTNQSSAGMCRVEGCGDHAKHALICRVGGGVERRHTALLEAVRLWLQDLGISVNKEQRMPKWDKPGKIAILDIAYFDRNLQQVCVDVSVIDGAEGSKTTRPQGTKAKFAIPRREKVKHVRYPGDGLFPFVVDTRGRWGSEAKAWAAAAVRHLPQEERSRQIRKLRVSVSLAVQHAVAEQILSASKRGVSVFDPAVEMGRKALEAIGEETCRSTKRRRKTWRWTQRMRRRRKKAAGPRKAKNRTRFGRKCPSSPRGVEPIPQK